MDADGSSELLQRRTRPDAFVVRDDRNDAIAGDQPEDGRVAPLQRLPQARDLRPLELDVKAINSGTPVDVVTGKPRKPQGGVDEYNRR